MKIDLQLKGFAASAIVVAALLALSSERVSAGVPAAATASAKAHPSAAPSPHPSPAPSPPPDPAKTAQGQKDFLEIARVLQSPRCRNCHPSGNAPLQGDDKPHRHAMNISRASVDSGLRCSTCHRSANYGIAGAPPGAKGWNMPSAAIPMVFEGKNAHDLCVQLTDPAKTSGRNPEQIKEHFGHDPLVMWAWSPGPGRTAPPITHDELMKHVDGWVAAGTPCPP